MSLYSRLDRLAADVEKLNKQVTAVSNQPQSQRTSVEGGSIDFNDSDGNLRAIVGGQDDGGNTINVVTGPTPPTPVNYTVTVDHGSLTVHWDGEFEDDAVAPTDWARWTAYAQPGEFVVPERSTAIGGTDSASGGEVTAGVLKGQWTVTVLAWSQAGKPSVMGDPVTVEVPGYGEIVLEEIDAAQTRIENARAILVEGQETLGEKLDESEAELTDLRDSLADLDSTTLPALRQDLDAAEGRLTSAETQISDATTDLALIPDKISTARQEAIDAALSEIENAEGDLVSSIDKKVNWSLSNPPVVFDGPADATWFKLSSFGSGGQVVSQWRWNGTVWVSTIMSESVLAKINIGTGTFGSMSGSRLDVGSVTADRVLVGAGRNILPWSQVLSGETVEPHVNWNYYGEGTLAPAPADAAAGVPGHAVHTRTTNDPDTDRYVIKLNPAAYTHANADKFAVSGGVWSLSVRGYTDVADLDAKLTLIWYKADGGYGSARTSAPVRLGPQPKLVEVSLELPDDAAYMVAGIRTNQPGETHWVNPELAPAVGGTLIEPGGIQTPHLAADVLEVGNLKAGTAEIAEAVVQKIAAQTASIQTADIKNLFVTGTASLSDVVAERIAAETAEFIELEVGNLVAGTGTMDEATITKLFADVVVAGMSIATEFIGENAILTGAVTASKITASEELWAKLGQFVNVRAEMIDSDAFTGRVFTGNTYLTSDGGGQWSDAGWMMSDPDGKLLFNFPTDGSPASIDVDNINIRSASLDELDVGDTSLTAGSTFTLEAGQLAYPRAPEVRADWFPSATFSKPGPGYSHDWTGLAAWGDKWVRTLNVLGAPGDGLDAIKVYDADGILEKTISIDNNPRHGVAVIGDIAYVLGPDRVPRPGVEKNWVHGFDLNTGARVTRWEFDRFQGVSNSLAVSATPGGKLLVAGVTNTPLLYVMQYFPTTGVQYGPDASTEWDLGYTRDLTGVAKDGQTLYVSHQRNVRTYTYFGSSLVRKSPDLDGWENPNRNAAGLDMTRGWPFVVTEGGNLFEGSTFEGGDNTIEAAVTFRDGSGHETDSSPVAMTGLSARESVSVSIPARPGLTPRVYYRLNNGVWQWWDSVDPATKRFWIDFIPGTREASAPTANTFPNSDPSLIQAAAGPFEVRGDGSGKWGPLTFNADGTMTSSSVPAWVPVTTFTGGASAGTFGRAPAYRVWPDGKVEWRGIVATPDTVLDTGGSTPFITIPAAAVPNGGVYLQGVGNSSINIRIDVQPDGKLRAQPTLGNTMKWFSLDAVFYYKS